METNPRNEARALVEKAMAETGWSLDDIAHRMDYSSLKRAVSGEIAFPDNRRRHLQDLVLLNRAYGPSIVTLNERESQDLEPLRTTDDPANFGGKRGIHPIDGKSQTVQPAARVLKSPLDKHGENTTAELMIELLQDFRQSSGVKRQWLAGQIRDLANTIGSTQETTPSPFAR